jgi:peptide-methionine (S)-S-oxide reductase
MTRSSWVILAGAAAVATAVAFSVLANGRDKARAPLPPASAATAVAIFAGGCFWCMEGPFEKQDGVWSVTSGFTGGRVPDPTYDQVSAGGTGHAEAVRIVYDPKKIDFARLLQVFWHNIDPFSANGQFCDRGSQYRSAVFYLDGEQKRLAEDSKKALEARFGRPVVTEIVPSSTFYAAEEYHQDFYKKSPLRYRMYREGCGRDRRLREIWGNEAGH